MDSARHPQSVNNKLFQVRANLLFMESVQANYPSSDMLCSECSSSLHFKAGLEEGEMTPVEVILIGQSYDREGEVYTLSLRFEWVCPGHKEPQSLEEVATIPVRAVSHLDRCPRCGTHLKVLDLHSSIRSTDGPAEIRVTAILSCPNCQAQKTFTERIWHKLRYVRQALKHIKEIEISYKSVRFSLD